MSTAYIGILDQTDIITLFTGKCQHLIRSGTKNDVLGLFPEVMVGDDR